MKKFNPLILKKTSGKYSAMFIFIIGRNVIARINTIKIAQNNMVNLIPRKIINVEIIPSKAFLEFV